MRVVVPLVLLALISLPLPSRAARPPATASPDKPVESLAALKARMETVARGFHGVLGYSLHNLRTGDRLSYNGDEAFPSASTIKTAVMCEVMQQVEEGRLKWSDYLPVVPAAAGRESGGFAYFFPDGTTVPLPEWLDLMIDISDNTAEITLTDKVGMANINGWLKDHGFTQTRILNGPDTDILGLRSL